MHRQLSNQIRRTLGIADSGQVDAVFAELRELAATPGLSDNASRVLNGLEDLFQRIGVTYDQFDRDVELRTRSLQLSSDELAAANEKQQQESIVQQATIEQLRLGVNELLRAENKVEIESGTAGLSELATTMAAMVHERSVVQKELQMQKFAMDEHAIITITDLNGSIIYANERFCIISGYSYEELIGQNHRLINSKFHPNNFFKTLWQTVLAGQVWRGEIRNRNKSGRMYWVSATIVPLLGNDGRPERFIAMRTDITNRKLAEAAMEESREFLQGITDNLDDGLFRLDDDMQCVFINPSAEVQLGSSLLKLLDEPFFEAIGFCDHRGRRVDIHTLLAGIEGDQLLRSEDFYLTHTDGHIFPVSLVLAPLGRTDGGWVGSFRDITERKFIQDALKVSERRLSVAFDAAETFLWEWNLDSGDGFVSDNFYPLLGYNRGDIVFQWNTVAGLLHPDDAASELEARNDHLQGRSDHYTVEHRLHLGNGEWRWFCSTGKVTAHDADNQPLRFTGIAYDIHERKHAQEQLAAAKIQADHANYMKGQFLANMSHELRTPLNAVIGLGHLVQQSDLQPQQRNYLQKMESASQHLLGLINDILDYSKIEAGKLTIEKIPLSLVETVRDIINLLQPKAQQKQLILLFEVAQHVPEVVLGDRKRLGQILLNLTDNALKFTERGTVTVRLSGTWMDDGRFHLEVGVRDQGIGLSAEQMEKLFKPFVQADTSTARKFGGTGLGLAICRELVELMGGQIGVDSTLGVGSYFHFELPCTPGEHRQTVDANAAPQKSTPAFLGYSALIVEDDPLNRLVATSLLESWGMLAETASSGAEALQLLRDRHFDIVLQDIQLPDMSGFDVVRCMRGELGLTDIPIIALTGHTADEERAACLDAGANDFISKPYDFDDLANMVRRLLGVSDASLANNSVAAEVSAPTPLNLADLMELMERVEPLLTAFDPDLLDVAKDIDGVCQHSEYADVVRRFLNDLENFDFVQARKNFDDLKMQLEKTTGGIVHE